jgi:hypothetical protein
MAWTGPGNTENLSLIRDYFQLVCGGDRWVKARNWSCRLAPSTNFQMPGMFDIMQRA